MFKLLVKILMVAVFVLLILWIPFAKDQVHKDFNLKKQEEKKTKRERIHLYCIILLTVLCVVLLIVLFVYLMFHGWALG